MWWIMSAGDKYIINYYLGDDANGLYSLALKIPQIINMVYALFIQAWQMSAIEVNQKNDKASFYRNVFNVTSFVMVLLTAGIIMLIKPLYTIVMSTSFEEAWMYVPLLSVATIISCYASFFSVVYTVGTKTRKVFTTTALGAVTNLAFNFALVQLFGMQGIATGTCLGYLAVLLVRSRDMKKEMGITIYFERNIVSFVFLLAQAAILILVGGVYAYGFSVLSIIVILYLYRNEMKQVIQVFKEKFRRR